MKIHPICFRSPYLILLLSIVYFQMPGAMAQDTLKSLDVFQRSRPWNIYQNSENSFYQVIAEEACRQLNEREQTVAGIKNKKEWMQYQENLYSRFFRSMNRFEKTPLNARTTGYLERNSFTVEKVLFESHPGFFVTAALYIPKNLDKPAPAIVYCCGHTLEGIRTSTYQHVPMNLAMKGFVVLAFDPLGQGERLQYVDKVSGKAVIGKATTEHSFAGVQCLMTGSSISDYFIWDGVRAIDYLETRKEVDMSRIGITGRSGGGLQSALIAAYDERVYAAAPECYLTSFKRLYQSIGPQDAEQNPYAAINKGFDHADYLHLRAPKPTLMITTTHDFFSQHGSRETFEKGLRSYTAFGKPENLQMVEDLGRHQSTPANRKAMYAFFQEHLKLPGKPDDLETEIFTEEELQITTKGQVALSYPAENVFSLNRKYFRAKELAPGQLLDKVKSLSGIKFNRNLESSVFTGQFRTGNYIVEKYFLENQKNDFVLPVYVAGRGNAKKNKILVWLHPDGKEAILDDPYFQLFLNAGYTIISCDLLGTGELRDSSYRGDGTVQGVTFNFLFGAQLTGKSIAAYQAESIDLLVQFLQQEFGNHGMEYSAYIEEATVLPFLHYSAFKNPFSKLIFCRALSTVRDLLNTEYYDPSLAYTVVPGSLPWYDMEELYSLLIPGTYLVSGEINGKGEIIRKELDFHTLIQFLNNNAASQDLKD